MKIFGKNNMHGGEREEKRARHVSISGLTKRIICAMMAVGMGFLCAENIYTGNAYAATNGTPVNAFGTQVTGGVAHVAGAKVRTAGAQVDVMRPATNVRILGAQAAILTDCASQESSTNPGGGVKCVILKVVNILSILVGIVGVIGIVIVGIQYLTAGGSEEQTRKAKRRLFEIVIGVAAYVLIAAALNWLLPNYNP